MSQRTRRLVIRLTEQEEQAIGVLADTTGLPVSTYVRSALPRAIDKRKRQTGKESQSNHGAKEPEA